GDFSAHLSSSWTGTSGQWALAEKYYFAPAFLATCMSALCQLRTHALQQRRSGTARTQAGALPTSHIAPGRRTLAPFRCTASASRTDAVAAETTSAGSLRNQLLTAPILVD